MEEAIKSPSSKSNTTTLIIAVVCGIAGFLLLLAAIILFVLFKRKKQGDRTSKTEVAMETVKKDRYKIYDIEIQEKLGGGNFGEVYKGVWKELTIVALKKLKDEKQLTEFTKEAEILK